MLVLPSDHTIENNDIYISALSKTIKAASKNNNIITLGITPLYPESGYGY